MFKIIERCVCEDEDLRGIRWIQGWCNVMHCLMKQDIRTVYYWSFKIYFANAGGLSVNLFCPSVFLSIPLSAHRSILCRSICLSVCLSVPSQQLSLTNHKVNSSPVCPSLLSLVCCAPHVGGLVTRKCLLSNGFRWYPDQYGAVLISSSVPSALCSCRPTPSAPCSSRDPPCWWSAVRGTTEGTAWSAPVISSSLWVAGS